MRPAPTVCCHVPREERRLVGTALRHAEFSWSWHSEGAPHRVMPSDTTELLFVEPAGVLLVAGPSWGPRRAAPLEATMFGVRLRASVHWRVLGLEPRELKDELVLAESLPGLRPLARRVSGLSAASARPHVLHWLESQAAESDASLEAAVQALWDGASLSEARSMSGLSLRTFERRFLRATGAPAKRLELLARTTRALQRGPSERWGEAAARAGFADQAHLVRACRAFFGVAPSALGCGHAQPTR